MKKNGYNIKKSKSIFLIPIDDFFEKNDNYNIYSNHTNIFLQCDNETIIVVKV